MTDDVPELWHLATNTGTILAIEDHSGVVRHAPVATAGFSTLSAWFAQTDSATCFLLPADGGNDPIIDGDAFRAGPLSYRLHATEPGTFALVNPSTAKFLAVQPPDTATLVGIVSAGAETLDAATRFTRVPAPHAFRIPALHWLTSLDSGPGGILSPDAIVAMAVAADPIPVAVLAALLRLLPEDPLRLLIPKLARTPFYPELFEYVRQHLGKQGPHLWGGTTQAALDFWIRSCGYKVGRHTYGSPTIWSGLLFKESTHLTIGKYCAIAGNIDLVMANHRTRWASTYPFAILHDFWPGVDGTISDHIARPIVIGNDVWIGAHACILPGAQVGDGAVLAAYAQVRGVVPPYAIVSGNPGRVIGYRFSEPIIARLLKVRWWDWPDWKVDSFLPLMMSDDITRFLDAAEADMQEEPSAPPPLPATTPAPPAPEDPLQALGALATRLERTHDPALRDIAQALAIIQQQLAARAVSDQDQRQTTSSQLGE